MKIKLIMALTATVMAGSVMAQSAFQGFYGQIATGYESNSASGLSSPLNITDGVQTLNLGNASASNQNFGGMPLVAGLGYNYSVAPRWLVGVGADYSFLSQESSSYSYSVSGVGEIPVSGVGLAGAKIKASNRFNIFITPGYEIDKDKLVYLKAGYSSVKVDVTAPSSITFQGQSVSLGGLVSNQSKTISGYIVGLGYKQIISGGIYAYGEANYMSYGSANFGRNIAGPNTGGVSFNTNTSSSLNSYQLLVGVGYKF
jgi:outer membrane immunogenic protein